MASSDRDTALARAPDASLRRAGTELRKVRRPDGQTVELHPNADPLVYFAQVAINAVLVKCGDPQTIHEDGFDGPRTREALGRVLPIVQEARR